MSDFTENDLREIERERDLPPDKLYEREKEDDYHNDEIEDDE